MQVLPKILSLPIANKDIDSTEKATPININVLANDSIFGDATNLGIIEAATKGSVVVNLDNSITYTPYPDYCDSGNPDFFMYGICNENGCDTAIVEIKVACTTMEFLSGFSPNNDGVNDFFTIRGVQAFPNNELTIFNRWGNIVFKQKGYKNKWNGTFKDKDLPDGTYFYLLKDGNAKSYSGFVQVMRG